MQFTTSLMALVASAVAVNAATVTFWTLDDAQRTIYFTPSAGYAATAPVVVNNKENTTVEFPNQYIGNYYAVIDGELNVPGMLGELTFGGWEGKTYFDVSAIVSPHDKNNVKQMWPAVAKTPMSGCEEFPCDNCYWLSGDVQTKVTPEIDLVSTLGQGFTGYSFE